VVLHGADREPELDRDLGAGGAPGRHSSHLQLAVGERAPGGQPVEDRRAAPLALGGERRAAQQGGPGTAAAAGLAVDLGRPGSKNSACPRSWSAATCLVARR